MENFWQQFCNKNIVTQVSRAFSGNVRENSDQKSDLTGMEIFQFDESLMPAGDTFEITTALKSETIQETQEQQQAQTTYSKADTSDKPCVTFKGQPIDMDLKTTVEKDGTSRLNGKTKDGKYTYTAKKNQNGEITSYRVEHHCVNGRGEEWIEAEFYERQPTDKNGKEMYILGEEIIRQDAELGEYSTITTTSYEGTLNKTGRKLSVTKGSATAYDREFSTDVFNSRGQLSGQGFAQGEGIGLNRSYRITPDGEIDTGTDYINLDIGKTEDIKPEDTKSEDKEDRQYDRLSFSTPEFERATSIDLTSSDDSYDTSSGEFDVPMDEISETITRTVDEDIIKNGGSLKRTILEGGVEKHVEEFYREENGTIVKGYKKYDTHGKVLEDYTETYNPESKASDIQQIVYDSETGKYYGKKEEYRCEDGINLEHEQSYYIQGDIGNIMRYTSGQFRQDGTFQADGISDTVRFEKSDKEYSVAEIQHLLTV